MVCAGHLNPDYWGNKVPPEAKGGFAAEDESVVMRYQDGRVTTAPEYRWSREVWRQEGTIRRAQNSNKIERYKERAIFSSSPFLPIIISKVDPTAHDVGSVPGNNCDYRWRLLHFRRSEQHAGVSLVNHESSGAEYVVGRNPSWMPSLVPSVFANTCSRSRDSHGLGGELPILLGLMAFWEHPSIPHKERMAKTFIGDNAHWRDYQWTAETEPRGCKSHTKVNRCGCSFPFPQKRKRLGQGICHPGVE